MSKRFFLFFLINNFGESKNDRVGIVFYYPLSHLWDVAVVDVPVHVGR